MSDKNGLRTLLNDATVAAGQTEINGPLHAPVLAAYIQAQAALLVGKAISESLDKLADATQQLAMSTQAIADRPRG